MEQRPLRRRHDISQPGGREARQEQRRVQRLQHGTRDLGGRLRQLGDEDSRWSRPQRAHHGRRELGGNAHLSRSPEKTREIKGKSLSAERGEVEEEEKKRDTRLAHRRSRPAASATGTPRLGLLSLARQRKEGRRNRRRREEKGIKLKGMAVGIFKRAEEQKSSQRINKMIEAAIFSALIRLGFALGADFLRRGIVLSEKEHLLFVQIRSSMGRIQTELEVMQGSLSQIDMRLFDSQAVKSWIARGRKLTYHIEDTLDEYIYIVSQQQGSGLGRYVKKIIKGHFSFDALRDIGDRLKEREEDLVHLSKVKDRWIVQMPSILGTSSDNVYRRQFDQATSSHFLDEEELVGIEENRKILTKLLESEETAVSVISVWGMGGLGKTTLVTNMYKRESQNFDCHAWISVSQSYKIDDILRELAQQLYGKDKVPKDIQKMDTRKLKETVRMFLGQKRYLNILDDVWSPADFHLLRDTLVNNDKASRIVITTRIEEVSSLAYDRKVELKPLSDDESWDLFCKKAFGMRKGHACPPEIEKYAKEIVSKCEGLPLAIVSIGSLLSLRGQSESEWKRVYGQLTWELEHNPNLDHVRNILMLSYSNLPMHLKSCFLYCSMFPEDYLISRKWLIRLWIAEGFVEEKGANTMEEVAEDYLKELIHRSMLQVVQRNSFGRVKTFRMHDLIRELALSLSKRESFHEVYNDSATARVDNDARRLSILKCSKDMVSSINLPRLRTLIAFDTTMLSYLFLSSISSKSKYLTVLDLGGLPIETLPDAIGNLFNLRYLRLRYSSVKSLPKSIGKLYNLKTLDLLDTEVTKLPHEIVKLRKLRHLCASTKTVPEKENMFHIFTAIRAPEGLWNLKELQTLMTVEASGELVGRLENLTQLRSLWITKLKGSQCARLCASLSQMHLLSHLGLIASDENEVLQLDGLIPTSPHLYRLFLRGQLSEGTFNSSLFHAHQNSLKELYLTWCRLPEDPLSSFCQLSSLTTLFLDNAFYGTKMSFRTGWFPNLQSLFIQYMPNVSQVKIEYETMVSLKVLQIVGLKKLEEVPRGILFLKSLKELAFYEPHPNLKAWLGTSNVKSMFQHVPTIKIE